MWFEIWQIALMLAVFGYGLFHIQREGTHIGFEVGYNHALEQSGTLTKMKDQADAVLDALEEHGIIYRYVDENGEEHIEPVQYYDEEENA